MTKDFCFKNEKYKIFIFFLAILKKKNYSLKYYFTLKFLTEIHLFLIFFSKKREF